MLKATLSSLAISGLLAATAVAQTDAATIFAAIDTNADGFVTEMEFLAYNGEDSKDEFPKIAGDDGAITLDEMKAYMGEGQ